MPDIGLDVLGIGIGTHDLTGKWLAFGLSDEAKFVEDVVLKVEPV